MLIRTRTWRWLAVRIEGLINRPPASYYAFPAPDGKGELIKPVWATRVQQSIYDTEGG